MNILFVNYGDFTTNSLNHIGGFANTMCASGHACAVAVPHRKETLRHIAAPLFIATTYEEAAARPNLFPDGRSADVIHAWTPRECVRAFTLAYRRAALAAGASPDQGRLLIHLEDNERFLLESFTGRPLERLRAASDDELARMLDQSLPHPVRSETFLGLADGVTHIIAPLAELAPPGVPTHLLFPGVDFALYGSEGLSDAEQAALRRELGLSEKEKVIAFTGSNTFANEPEMRDLYVAVALLNQRGIPVRLVRTGFNSPRFLAGLNEDLTRHVLDLGFIEKKRLPALLALADVLVQPGRPGPFNDLRLPSKLPEFLASGRPVILPPTNLAALMQDGTEAAFLPATGTPADIADACARILADPDRGATLGRAGAAFARKHFDLAANTRALGEFYAFCLERPPVADWAALAAPTTSDATLFAGILAGQLGRAAAELDDAAARQLAEQTALLADVVRQLEQSIEAAARQRTAAVEADRDAIAAREQLTQNHVRNIEGLLAAAREHAAGLEKARDLTQAYADNIAKECEKHKFRRDQADTLLANARRQVTAYENALIGADAEIAALKEDIARLEEALATSRAETAAGLAEQARLRAEAAAAESHLRAVHAAELAVAADKLAQVEAIVRSRDEKLAKIQSSFSWKVTAPLRELRRRFLDQPAPPAASPALIGNIDYPQDWSVVAETLSVRGWSLLRDRRRLQAIRAKLGETPAHAVFGDERLDVLDHFRDYPGAERCGWQVKAAVPRRGTHILLIEVQDEAGAWHIAHARPVRRSGKAAPPPPNTYGAWVAAYDTLTPESAAHIRTKLAGLNRRPLISVILPVYNTPEKLLVAAIESVRRQLYENWELCISDDASKQPHVRKVLERYQRKDPKRIKVVLRETNGHISANSNSALALAHGEFIALLDHDDELRAHALACVALELDAHPEADVVYSDEDKIDENGHRYDHYFKPDWNPDLFNVQNFISHLGVYRTLLVREVGGFRVGYEGSQDWDLAMRVIERSAPDRIRHIPRILYHWRSVPGSTAMLIGEKPFAAVAAEKVITEHFIRTGVEATISPTKGSYWRVHYPVPDPAPRVTLIIPTRNRLNVLQPCVDSLLAKTEYPDFEILIVDNDSDDPATLDYLAAITAPEEKGRAPVRVIRSPGEFNYSALNNLGFENTDAPLVGLLNNDLEVIHGDWLREMVSHAIRPEIGCVGAKLYYPDDRIQHAGVILGIGGVAAHAWQTHPRGAAGQAHRNYLQQNLSAVTAACLVIRRETFLRVGGLNADQLKVAFNDVDFCLKVRAAGFRNLWTPYAELYHHESASRGKEDTLEKRDRFRSEVEYMRAAWGDLLDNDPAYNPNLTLTINDFTLALPPRDWPPLR